MARATELPLSYTHHHLETTALLNGKPAVLFIDTGAEETVLVAAAASRLSLPLEPAGTATGIGGSASRYVFVARRFQIGTLHGTRLTLAASDTAFGPESKIDGLLGVDFLAAYDLDLDLKEHKALLFAKIAGCSHPTAVLTGQLYGVPMIGSSNPNDHRPFVSVEVGGKRMVALIDSGSPGTVIFRNAARRLGLDIANLPGDRRFKVGGMGPGHPDAVRHVLTPMTVGDLTISNMPAAIVDQHSFDEADMLLGLDFLSRVHVWYSFSSHTLVMQYPPLASPSASQ